MMYLVRVVIVFSSLVIHISLAQFRGSISNFRRPFQNSQIAPFSRAPFSRQRQSSAVDIIPSKNTISNNIPGRNSRRIIVDGRLLPNLGGLADMRLQTRVMPGSPSLRGPFASTGPRTGTNQVRTNVVNNQRLNSNNNSRRSPAAASKNGLVKLIDPSTPGSGDALPLGIPQPLLRSRGTIPQRIPLQISRPRSTIPTRIPQPMLRSRGTIPPRIFQQISRSRGTIPPRIPQPISQSSDTTPVRIPLPIARGVEKPAVLVENIDKHIPLNFPIEQFDSRGSRNMQGSINFMRRFDDSLVRNRVDDRFDHTDDIRNREGGPILDRLFPSGQRVGSNSGFSWLGSSRNGPNINSRQINQNQLNLRSTARNRQPHLNNQPPFPVLEQRPRFGNRLPAPPMTRPQVPLTFPVQATLPFSDNAFTEPPFPNAFPISEPAFNILGSIAGPVHDPMMMFGLRDALDTDLTDGRLLLPAITQTLPPTPFQAQHNSGIGQQGISPIAHPPVPRFVSPILNNGGRQVNFQQTNRRPGFEFSSGVVSSNSGNLRGLQRQSSLARNFDRAFSPFGNQFGGSLFQQETGFLPPFGDSASIRNAPFLNSQSPFSFGELLPTSLFGSGIAFDEYKSAPVNVTRILRNAFTNDNVQEINKSKGSVKAIKISGMFKPQAKSVQIPGELKPF